MNQHPECTATSPKIQDILKFGPCQTLTCNASVRQISWGVNIIGFAASVVLGLWARGNFPRAHKDLRGKLGGSSASSREFRCPSSARHLDGGSIGKELRKRQLQ